MHHRDVVVRRCAGLGELELLEVNSAADIPIRAASGLLYTVPFNTDIFVTIDALMFVMEPESMENFMRCDAIALAGNVEVQWLRTGNTTDVAMATA